jgi:hypothetical protein
MRFGADDIVTLRYGSHIIVAAYIGDIQVWPRPTRDFEALLAAVSGSSAHMIEARALIGALQATSDLNAHLIRMAGLTGNIPAVSTMSGDMLRLKLIAGALNGISDASAVTSIERAISASLDAQSGASGAVSIVKALAATQNAVSAISGALSRNRAIAGALAAVSAMSGALSLRLVVGTAGSYANAADLTTYTATGLPAIAANERGVIAIAARQSSTRTIVSVTHGGQACSELHAAGVSGTSCAIYLSPVGATGDVVVQWSGSEARCVVGLWPTRNMQNIVASDVASSSASPMSLSIDCPAGGAIFAVAYNNTNGAYTWTNLDGSIFSQIVETNTRVDGRGEVFTTAQTGRVITADVATESNPLLVAVSII